MTSATCCSGRSLVISAKPAPSISENFFASFARPASPETTTTSSGGTSPTSSLKCSANSGTAVMWSTGILKKPCTCPACRSIVSTRSAPDASIMSATSLEVIGSRGALFLSCREYGYQGMTAVIRLAEASRAALIMISSSISESFVGEEHDWTMNTSAPRIDSS